MWTHMANWGQQAGYFGHNPAAMGSRMGYYGMPGPGMASPMNGQAMGYMGMPGYGFDPFLGGILTTLFTVLLWALLLAGAVFLARGIWDAFNSRKQGIIANATTNQPLEILKQRLAKGEISRTEFEEVKRVLA